MRIHHHDAAGLGLEGSNLVAQLLVGEELHFAVDRQLDVLPLLGRRLHTDAVDNAAQAVLDHPARTGLAAQLGVEGQLHAFLALVFHIGEAHHVGG